MKKSLLGFAALAVITGSSVVAVSSLPASAAGTVPADVQTGIDDAKVTVQALSPLALAALTVALIPMGSMLTLRFLNMVLSRV
jgi:hypothetical protein